MAYKGFNIDVRNYMEDCSSNPRDIILLFNDAYLVQMTQFLTLLGVWRHHSKASNYIRLVLPVWTMFIRLKGEPTNILLYKKLLRLKSIWIKSIIVFFLLFPFTITYAYEPQRGRGDWLTQFLQTSIAIIKTKQYDRRSLISVEADVCN